MYNIFHPSVHTYVHAQIYTHIHLHPGTEIQYIPSMCAHVAQTHRHTGTDFTHTHLHTGTEIYFIRVHMYTRTQTSHTHTPLQRGEQMLSQLMFPNHRKIKNV